MSDVGEVENRELSLNEWLRPDLAGELAARLRPVHEIAARYDLTTADIQKLLSYPAFRNMVSEAKALWASDLNAEQRVRAKAALAVEDTIKDMHGIVVDGSVQPRQRADAFSKLARVAQLDSPPVDSGGGRNYSLVINIPGVPAITASAPVIEGQLASDDTEE